jgi:hypothetical protein
MKSAETGHAKNIANFESLINFCVGYGSAYKPARTILSIDSLKAKLEASKTAFTETITKETHYRNAARARLNAFKDFKKLSTRIVNALAASGSGPHIIDAARTLNRKVQGSRATRKPEITDERSATRIISSSQQGFATRLEHFQGLIDLIATQPEYTPNEEELKVPALKSLIANLSAANNRVSEALVEWSNARLVRTKNLYQEEDGLADVALDVKKYLKSVFGAVSLEYKQVQGIIFRKKF